MPDPLTPSPPEEPLEPQKKSSFLPIVLLLGLFFLIVLVAALLLLPDRGKKLLKLTDATPVTQTLHAATYPGAPSSTRLYRA